MKPQRRPAISVPLPNVSCRIKRSHMCARVFGFINSLGDGLKIDISVPPFGGGGGARAVRCGRGRCDFYG